MRCSGGSSTVDSDRPRREHVGFWSTLTWPGDWQVAKVVSDGPSLWHNTQMKCPQGVGQLRT